MDIMKNKDKIWFACLNLEEKSSDETAYYNKNDFPFAKLLEDNYGLIKEEVQAYIEKNEDKIEPYFNKTIVTKANSWRTFAFVKWSWEEKKNLMQCPKTKLILDKIPNLVSASISILEKQSRIIPHRGDTTAVVRAHLAIEIPATLPNCGFEVNNQKRSWEEGKVMIFNDTALHTAFNYTEKRRYVMMLDVIKPDYADRKYFICSTVLGGLVMQSIFFKLPFVQSMPRFILLIIFYLHVGLINIVLRIRNLLGI